jgi:pimeloyl-ACP methyl ester carboxylesterase
MEFFSGTLAGPGSGLKSGLDPLYAAVLEPEFADKPEQQTPEQPLVLLHPTPLHHAFWLPVAQRLSGYRRVLPDLRGHGRSPLGAAPSATDPGAPTLTVEQLVADTLALLDTLHIERAIFVGCSIGGYTLYQLWRTAPERVAGLVFCASKPQADTDAERAKRADWIAKMEPARLSGELHPVPEFIDAMLTALLSKSTHRDHPALVAEVRAMMEQVRPEAIQAIQRGLGQRPDARQTALTISVPTCVIAGAEDTSSTPADLSALHTTLLQAGSRSAYHLLSNAGHYAPFEQPAIVVDILDTFCRSVGE